MHVPLSPLDFRTRAVRLFANKTGLIDGEHRFTYREFGERTARLANTLTANGLRREDRVAYLAYNSYPLLEGYYGVPLAGGILLPLNIRLSPPELQYILQDAGARWLLVDQDFASILPEIVSGITPAPKVVWLTGVPPGRSEPLYDDLLNESDAEEPTNSDLDENQVAELFYTSGTTARPKGVMLTHRNLYLHALNVLIALSPTDKDIQLHTIPLFHVNGWGTPHYLTAVGGSHVMLRKFDPLGALQLIEQERVTRFLAVPTMLNLILNHPDIHRFDISSLSLINTGGASTPPDMVRRAEAQLDCRVIGGYGLTETSPVIAFATQKAGLAAQGEEQRIRRQASTGLPILGVDLRVLSRSGTEVDWNATDVGEIVVRSNVVMDGYWNDPESTDAVIVDGWLRTGDLAVVDEEGYVLIVDRAKDLIVSGGENIASVEIEKVLFEHPLVLECAVIGVPDERWGEVPKALIVAKPGCSVEQSDVLEFCGARLAAFKVPKSCDFVDSLPKGGTGKILKRALREPFWAGTPQQKT